MINKKVTPTLGVTAGWHGPQNMRNRFMVLVKVLLITYNSLFSPVRLLDSWSTDVDFKWKEFPHIKRFLPRPFLPSLGGFILKIATQILINKMDWRGSKVMDRQILFLTTSCIVSRIGHDELNKQLGSPLQTAVRRVHLGVVEELPPQSIQQDGCEFL